MTVDQQLVEGAQSFADPDAGVRERFLTPRLGGAHTVAILSTPIAGRAETGWVLCGSFGSEQGYLLPFEVSLARRLGAAGYAVLRYHGQGYGDSELPSDAVSMRSHRRDALDAVGLLRELEPDLRAVGLAGARFGASVAALVAAEARVDALALIDPVVSGAAYVRAMLGRSVISALSAKGAASRTATPAAPNVSTMVDVEGTQVDRAVLDELAALDLAATVEGFRGVSLILQVSRVPEPRKAMELLRRRLSDLGGRADLRVMTDPDALRFGLPRFRRARGSQKVDIQAGLTERLASETVRWADSVSAELLRGRP